MNPDINAQFDQIWGKTTPTASVSAPNQARADEIKQIAADAMNPRKIADAKSAETYHPLFPAAVGEDSPSKAGLKSAGNAPSSLVHLGENLFNAFRHPIDTLGGVGNAALGAVQEGVQKTTGVDLHDEQARRTYNALSDALKERYGSLDNLQRTATNDPAGFGADVLSILEGGAGALGKTAELNSVLSKTAEIATAPARATGSAIGRVVGEAEGVATGAGYGAIKEGMKAAMEGGDKAQAFIDSVRGVITPEQIVTKAKEALGTIIDNRREDYQTRLEGLKTNTTEFSHAPLIKTFDSLLDKFGVFLDEKGALDFSRSPGLGRYQSQVKQILQTLQDWGSRAGDNTVVGIDKLKQVIEDFRIGTPDAKRFDSFVTTLKKEAQGLIRNEPGYSELVGNYQKSSGLITEIQRGLSLGDKNMLDMAFRKLTSALRTNNEFRRQLVQELDDVSGGTLSSEIAGQQLGEWLPRGLMRVIGSAGGVATLARGTSIIPILFTAALTSPRVIGELINGLGLAKNVSAPLIKALNNLSVQMAPLVFPGRATGLDEQDH